MLGGQAPRLCEGFQRRRGRQAPWLHQPLAMQLRVVSVTFPNVGFLIIKMGSNPLYPLRWWENPEKSFWGQGKDAQ